MNFKMILILVLGLLIFTSQILFGIIFYNTYNNDTDKAKKVYEDYQWAYLGNAAILLLMLVVNGLIFLKA